MSTAIRVPGAQHPSVMNHGSNHYFAERARFEARVSRTTVAVSLAFLALLFVFIWERVAELPGYLPRFTLTAYLRSLIHHRPGLSSTHDQPLGPRG